MSNNLDLSNPADAAFFLANYSGPMEEPNAVKAHKTVAKAIIPDFMNIYKGHSMRFAEELFNQDSEFYFKKSFEEASETRECLFLAGEFVLPLLEVGDYFVIVLIN